MILKGWIWYGVKQYKFLIISNVPRGKQVNVHCKLARLMGLHDGLRAVLTDLSIKENSRQPKCALDYFGFILYAISCRWTGVLSTVRISVSNKFFSCLNSRWQSNIWHFKIWLNGIYSRSRQKSIDIYSWCHKFTGYQILLHNDMIYDVPKRSFTIYEGINEHERSSKSPELLVK